MSEEAVKIYEETLREQHSRNEARRIKTEVDEARGSIASAGFRWPFELLQNALDFGPRAGNSSVAIRLSRTEAVVAFEHDGVPFTSSDLAALLSGGSSKDLESEKTTGRFGTGFLVTHVLAKRANLQGLFETPNNIECFNLLLDRGGDEEAILKNMEECKESIRSASPVSDLDAVKSARFEYHIDDDNPLTLGIESFVSALPYLYATRQVLGQVELQNGAEYEVWTPTEVTEQAFEGGYVEERSLQVRRNGVDSPKFRIFRFRTSAQGSASALVLVEQTAEGFKVVPPGPNVCRIYREYPLSGSTSLPANFILDGKFAPDKDRSRPLMNNVTKGLLEDAFAAAVVAVKYAFANKWEDAHLLAKVDAPTTAFNAADAAERDWWRSQLASFANRVSRLPIVECTSRILPATDQGSAYADFIVPSLSAESSHNETTVERMWPLVEAASDLLPPRKELAVAWSEIAQGWHSLGVQVNRISVRELANWVSKKADTLDTLKIDGDAKQWLAHFLDVTGECWKNRSGVDLAVLDGMLPDQNQRLRSPSDLRRDSGISDSIKDICAGIGLDIRGQLLLGGLSEIAEKDGLSHLQHAFENALPNAVSEEEVIQQAVEFLTTALPEDENSADKPTDVQHGSVRLLHYLWETKQLHAQSIARRVPLITHDQRSVRWGPTRMMMAPIQCWHDSAQPFADAYPPNRILAEFYAGSASEDLPNCAVALTAWGIAIADPIFADTPSEITPRRLAELSSDDTDGVTVSNNDKEFSQIALLQPEVLNRCQDRVEAARALFGLVLCHVAPHDPEWKRARIVNGRKSRQPIDVTLASALWLADLRIRAWVPIPGEDGKLMPMPANAKTLGELLDPTWLENNDAAISLLSEWFEFDQLELRLLGIEPDDEKRAQLRDGLARLVETGGADPGFYSSLAEEVETRKRQSRDIERFRRMGIGVQEAIRSAMEIHKLNLKLLDRGFDYEVTVPLDDVLSDASTRFDIGPYLLEVKATTTGQVRLTPLQAKTASDEAHRYVLCVVDLRNINDEELDAEWSASTVEPLAKIVSDIGSRIEGTYSLVETARARPIAVRNESALRYEVPSNVWEAGISIGQWVSQVRGNVLAS